MILPGNTLILGTCGFVSAVDVQNGEERWRTSLKGYGLVTILWKGSLLFAASEGRLYRLDPQTGEILWRNDLEGLGYQAIHLALDGIASAEPHAAALRQRQQQASGTE